jgi:two-component system nitrogen regulation sensor histidine kinase NtrY
MTVEAAPLANALGSDDRQTGRRRVDSMRLIRVVGYVAMVLSLVSAATTFFILMGLTPIAPTPETVSGAMLINGGLVAVLIAVVAWEIISLVLAFRRGRAAARLHIRIVGLFSLIAAAPTVLIAVAASSAWSP